MAIYIKREDTNALVRELVARTGGSITDVVTDALREKLDRTPPRQSAQAEQDARFETLSSKVLALQALSATHPITDEREPDDILYDENGLPH